MTIILKPTYACNFRCRYCYLSNNTKLHTHRLDVELIKGVVLQLKEILSSSPVKRTISFIWHGGEPLLWGKENYRQALDFITVHLKDFCVKNSIQTNLSLIDEEYLDIFSRYNVKIGFSLDGDKVINDGQRLGFNGEPTYDIIMEKLSLCRNKGFSPGCIVVGSRKHIGRIPLLYQFMRTHNLNFKFNPLFIAGEAGHNIDEYSITADEYADMSIELFDLWFNDREGKIQESNFIEIASNIATNHVAGCMFKQNCQDSFMAITPYGEVMPCGRFCDEEFEKYSYGNLYEKSLSEILQGVKSSTIYHRAEHIKHSKCADCKWFDICHGGCTHDGFLYSGDFKHKTFLCSAYKKIFNHIERKMLDSKML